MFDEIFELDMIHEKPVYTLSECVAVNVKRSVETDDDDVEDSTDSVEHIIEHFRENVYLFNESELAFLRFAAEQTENQTSLKEAFAHLPFSPLRWNDYVYLFSWEDSYSLVFPVELIQIFREVTAEESFATVNARNLELYVYTKALLELYGTYEIEHFVYVWNHHHKDKITYKEAEDFLVNRAYYRSDYYFDENFVVHDCLDYREFEELWDQREEISYYLPTKRVIRELANRGYDDSKIPGEAEMDSFLAKYVEGEVKLDDLQMDIGHSGTRLHPPEEIKEILKRAGAPTDDESFCAEFDRLYNTLRDATHVWELRGYTPHQFREETGHSIPRFKLPRGKKRGKK
jgi:hypothetical protein